MGRPPGAHSGDDRRRGYPQNWEFRDAQVASRRLGERVEELGESDEDDGQGVFLDPAARRRAFVGDTLHFDGYDLGQHRTTRDRRRVYDDGYDDYYYSDEDHRDPRRQPASRPREQALVQAALDRIAQARLNGQTNVNLTREEMEALERRGSQPPEPASTALVSPPATPNKSKIKSASRNSSTNSLTAQKARKRSNSSFFSSPAKSNSKAKVTRKTSADHGSPQPPLGAPGVMVPGPDGVPVFAPIGYYSSPSPELQRPRSGDSRSSSKQSRRESTPPEQHYAPPRQFRPDSPGSRRSPEESDWYPPTSTARHRSASNAYYDYDMVPPGPAAPQGRRHASGPPDVRYASLRRAPQSSSPLAPRASPSGTSNLRRTETSSSSSSGEGQGVQVEIFPDENGGYAIRSAPAAAAAAPVPAAAQAASSPSGKEARRRKTGRR